MMYVELCRIGVGYLVDFLHLDHFSHEAIVNLNNPQAAVAAAQVLSGISLGGSAPLMVGIARVQAVAPTSSTTRRAAFLRKWRRR